METIWQAELAVRQERLTRALRVCCGAGGAAAQDPRAEQAARVVLHGRTGARATAPAHGPHQEPGGAQTLRRSRCRPPFYIPRLLFGIPDPPFEFETGFLGAFFLFPSVLFSMPEPPVGKFIHYSVDLSFLIECLVLSQGFIIQISIQVIYFDFICVNKMSRTCNRIRGGCS